MVNLEQSNYDTREDDGVVNLMLTLSQVSSETFEVVLTTADITATGECIITCLFGFLVLRILKAKLAVYL